MLRIGDDVLVYRAPMRSRRDGIDAGASIERALHFGLCGVGGALDRAPRSLDDAVALTAARYDERAARRVARFAAVANGSLVWTRTPDGWSWLGRVDGPWRYDDSDDAALVDLVHVRPCRWLPQPTSERDVPAAVRVTFARGGRNWQRIHDGAAEGESLALWRAATDEPR